LQVQVFQFGLFAIGQSRGLSLLPVAFSSVVSYHF
jgi:hypothetical protein